jgi:TldD protein
MPIDHGADDGVMSTLKTLAQRTDVDDLEIRLEINETTQIDTLNDQVLHQTHTFDVGGNVRVLVKGVYGFVHFDGWDNLVRHVDEAILLATWSKDQSSMPRLTYPAPIQMSQRLQLKESPLSVSLEDKVMILREYSDVAHRAHRAVKSVTARYFDRYRHWVWLL